MEKQASAPCHGLVGNIWYLSLLIVAKDREGKGIGSRFLNECIIPRVQDAGGESLSLFTNTELNRKFYEKNGFILFDERRFEYGGKNIGSWSYAQKLDGDGMIGKTTYIQIDQEKAKEMMAVNDGHVIVDVRRADEYAAGHIPGAILIPNESIGTEKPEQLPDKDQIILIYCRSGNRSKQAAQKLADMGYTNIYEFGGINTWTGEVVTE